MILETISRRGLNEEITRAFQEEVSEVARSRTDCQYQEVLHDREAMKNPQLAAALKK
jgi:hypothetical protein